ncbi:MAG: hypothetical protein WBG19_08270 [Thermoplasmata archaeon]
MRFNPRVCMILGISIGLILPLVILGVGVTHSICSQGPVIGRSGPLMSPWAIAVAPPGGFVNGSFSVNYTFPDSSYTIAGLSDLPMNSTVADYDVENWSLHSENSTEVSGRGPTVSCTSFLLVAGGESSSCTGCPIGPPTPGGIGQRVVVPEQFGFGSIPSAIINGSYNAPPIASFTFEEVGGGLQVSNPGNFSGLPVAYGPFYEHGELYGLGLTIRMHSTHFGVPIRLTNGTVENFTGSLPADLMHTAPSEDISLVIKMVYVLPVTTAAGTWDVYVAGAGNPYSIGGLLFEQTADP